MLKTYNNKGSKPTRTGFGEGLAEAGALFPEIICLGADITSSVGMNFFAEKFPERFFSLGIAEQNCAGVAAGLALSGKRPIFSTYGVFAALRAADPIRISICYNNLAVLIGGAHAGISVGPDGATHQALEDIAIMRSLPNMTVISPCDATQTRKAVIEIFTNCHSPVYLRFGREAVPDFTDEDQNFTIGKCQQILPGNQITLFATGHMVWEAIQAAIMLHQEGFSTRVTNIHTIKPIDIQGIIDSVDTAQCVLTIEEHQIFGGLGSAIAEVLVQHKPIPMKIIGMNDTFGESGKPEELMKKYGLTAKNIYQQAVNLCSSIPQNR